MEKLINKTTKNTMAKKSKVKVEGNTLTIEADNIQDALDALKPIKITSASIKEQKCNYGYEYQTGPTAGDKIPTRKSHGLIHEDLQTAFDALRVHLAIADDAFKHVFAELPALEDLASHEITQGYTFTGFKIQGDEEDEGYFLIGDKWVTLGTMGCAPPKIGEHSNYKYWDDLKEKIATALDEVEQYMNGKHAPDDEEDDKQQEIPFPGGKTSADEFDDEE